ncbi:putative AAA domain-containing protein [Escovopsis weberi]|uniref:Peroxisomal ATPase PEX1 n=1 Tax=Escovopsis weberi TaxID=150374 RepID=A0A0M8N2M7_ESCWE|nr:putative AAA domain-containing protein [Escovopsis weberi]
MAPSLHRPRINLRMGLDRDVYQIIKKFEDANDGKPFKTVSAAYDAIKRSNSSLSRQKKRPLEDSIDRVLQFRKEELADSEDSEAALDGQGDGDEDDEDAEIAKQEDERFLLNRQMTKLWNVEPVPQQPSTTATTTTTNEQPAAKKRRIQSGGDEKDASSSSTKAAGAEDASKDTPRAAEKQDKDKAGASKKTSKLARFKIEQLEEPVPLGGVGEMHRQLLRQTRYLLKCPELYEGNGWRRVPGILLYGPPGLGKKSLIRNLTANLGVPLITLNGCLEDPERVEKSLAEAVDAAMSLAPSIIFIEDLDWHMPKPGGQSHNEQSRKVLSLFTRQMQRIQLDQPRDRHVLAMATTSRLTDVDPVVLEAGLFERALQMRVPDLEARHEILKVVTSEKRLSERLDLGEVAKMTHGFVGADIVIATTLAEQVAQERILNAEDPDGRQLERLTQPLARVGREITTGPDDMDIFECQTTLDLKNPSFPIIPTEPVTLEDFKLAIKDFVPSLRREGFTVIPNVTWDQVGALSKIREQLHMSIIGPIKNPELYQEFGLRRPAGALLWGPPGCGKTLVAQAVASEAQASFILINGPELLNKYVGESERAVRELFQRARSSTPCILFFDEIDSLVPRRDSASTDAGVRVVNALLTELDGAQDRSGIYVIGTTNRPDMIDAAMLRPGRLSVRLFVDLPTPDERADILRAIYTTAHPGAPDAEMRLLPAVAADERCANFSGADLGGLHIKAAECALRRFMCGTKTVKEIDEHDWEDALANTRCSVMNPESYRKLDKKLSKGE